MASGADIFQWLHDSYTDSPSENNWQNFSWTYHDQNASNYANTLILTLPYGNNFADSTHLPNNKELQEHTNLSATTSAAHLGLSTGLFLAILLNSRVDTGTLKVSPCLQCFETMVLQFLFAAICLTLTVLAAPVMALFMVFLMCYRQGVHFFLKLTKSHYAGLLDGLDAIWAIEEDANKSVINVLTLIEVENIEQGSNLLETFRKMVIDRFATSPLPCPKIFHFRRKCLGYFYWERQTEFRIQDYIRSMAIITDESVPKSENNMTEISEEALKTLVAEVSNSKLPVNHAACWEVLIGSQPIARSLSQAADVFQAMEEDISESSTTNLLYPVLFRIHHSLGDGIALMHLLVSAMADVLPCTREEAASPLSIPPPVPIPNRKFPTNSNPSHETDISDTNIVCSRHLAQSPKDFKVNHSKISDDLSENDISIKIRSKKEDTIPNDRNKTENNAIQLSKETESVTYTPMKQSTMFAKEGRYAESCKQRPLLLKNNYSQRSTEFSRLNSSERNLSDSKVFNDEHYTISKHYPSSNFKNIVDDSNYEPCYRLTGSYNQSLNRKITSSDFSQSLSPNFHNSLPVLTSHQHSTLEKETLQKHAPNSTVRSGSFSPKSLTSFQEISFAGSPAKYLQDSPCSTKAQSRVPLEKSSSSSCKLERPTSIHLPQKIKLQERPTACLSFENNQNLKVGSKSTQDIPYFNSDHCNTNKLHCYSRSTSDSYITIAFNSEPVTQTSDKCMNTSTTIYYYNSNSPTFTPPVPTQQIQETKNYVRDEDIKHEENSVKAKDANHDCNKYVNENVNQLSGSSNSNFEECNFTTASQMSHESSLSRNSETSQLSDDVFLQSSAENTQLDLTEWNIVDIQNRTELPTIAEEETLDKSDYIPVSTKYHASAYSDRYNSFVRKTNPSQDSTDVTNTKLHHKTENTNYDSNVTTDVTIDYSDESRPINTTSRFKFDNLKKIWSNVISDENKDEHVQTLSSNTPPNQYVELLNTISNSNCSLSKYDKFSNFLQTVCALSLAPASVIHQALMRDADINSLHGPPLSGEKVIGWHQDPTGDLLKCVKRIKKNSKIRFTEVLLTALSASLETYFETHRTIWSDRVPEVVTIVIPARMENLSTRTIGKVNLTPEISRKTDRTGKDISLPIQYQETPNVLNNKTYSRSEQIKNLEESNVSNIEKDVTFLKTVNSKITDDKMKDWEEINNAHVKMNFKMEENVVKLDDSSQNTTVSLNNRFSLALLTLPITTAGTEDSGSDHKTISPRRRLNEVHHHSELLRKGLSYQVNYWLLRIAATFLPASLLGAVIESSQSTLVVSNIVGPTQELHIAGSRLRHMMFWVPNRGATGIGVTILSYQGHLQIGIIADKALITCKQDAQMILDETVLELYKLDAVISQ